MNLPNEGLKQSFLDNAVIEPPEVKPDFESYKKYTRVAIDSKDRNTKLFPLQNKYEVTLDDEIEDVVTAQLLNIDVPLSNYLINDYYRSFTVSVNNGSSTKVVLDIGDYDEAALAVEATNKLNAVFQEAATFEVTYVAKLDNFDFKCTTSFSLTYDDPCARVFGFKESNVYTSTSSGVLPFGAVIHAPFRKDFAYNNYIVMSVDQFDINKSNSNTLNRSFALITKRYKDMNISDDPQIKKHFSPPLARLTKIRLTFSDRFGNPYNFNNIDHHFEILFESYKQKRKYQNIFYTR